MEGADGWMLEGKLVMRLTTLTAPYTLTYLEEPIVMNRVGVLVNLLRLIQAGQHKHPTSLSMGAFTSLLLARRRLPKAD